MNIFFFPHILNVKSVKQTIVRITPEVSMDPIDELDSLSAASPRFPSTPARTLNRVLDEMPLPSRVQLI